MAVFQNYIYFIDGYNLKQLDTKTNNLLSIPLERKTYEIGKIIDKRLFIFSSAGKMQIFNLPLHELSHAGYHESLSICRYCANAENKCNAVFNI